MRLIRNEPTDTDVFTLLHSFHMIHSHVPLIYLVSHPFPCDVDHQNVVRKYTSFIYLGSAVRSRGNCDRGVSHRIGMAWRLAYMETRLRSVVYSRTRSIQYGCTTRAHLWFKMTSHNNTDENVARKTHSTSSRCVKAEHSWAI